MKGNSWLAESELWVLQRSAVRMHVCCKIKAPIQARSLTNLSPHQKERVWNCNWSRQTDKQQAMLCSSGAWGISLLSCQTTATYPTMLQQNSNHIVLMLAQVQLQWPGTGSAGTALCRCQAAWMLSANSACYVCTHLYLAASNIGTTRA